MSKGKIIALVITFIVSIALVVIGQKTVGYPYLAMQLLGLVGVLFVVWCYNRQYK